MTRPKSTHGLLTSRFLEQGDHPSRPWTTFEVDTLLGFICRGEHRVGRWQERTRVMRLLTQGLNRAVNRPRDVRDRHPDDRTLREVNALFCALGTQKKAALNLINRSFPSRLTRTKKRVFERNIGFVGNTLEWLSRRDKEQAHQRKMYKDFLARRELERKKEQEGGADVADAIDGADATHAREQDTSHGYAARFLGGKQGNATYFGASPAKKGKNRADSAQSGFKETLTGMVSEMDLQGPRACSAESFLGAAAKDTSDEYTLTSASLQSFHPGQEGQDLPTTAYQKPSASESADGFPPVQGTSLSPSNQQDKPGGDQGDTTLTDAFVSGSFPLGRHLSSISPMPSRPFGQRDRLLPELAGTSDSFDGVGQGVKWPSLPLTTQQEDGGSRPMTAEQMCLNSQSLRRQDRHERYYPPHRSSSSSPSAHVGPEAGRLHPHDTGSGRGAANGPPTGGNAAASTPVGDTASWLVGDEAVLDAADLLQPATRLGDADLQR